jgi:thiamine-monophosphate kinase
MNGARAAIDVSDGLLAELAHLAAASAVRIALDDAAVPVAPGATVDDALRGGEEYELVVAGEALDATAFARDNHLALTAIAVARAVGPAESPGVDLGGRVARERGHDHLSG